MDLEKEILKTHSKLQTLKIVSYIGNDQERFNDLFRLFLKGAGPVPQRASWALSLLVEKHPGLIIPHLKPLIQNLKNPVHDAVKRHTLRLMQYVEIPKSLWGITADLCFRFLSSLSEPVAVKAFAMTILSTIAEKEPDLKNELRIIIEDQIPHASPAFTSRGRKILKLLQNEKVRRP